MLLTISTTHRPATDLGFLLAKHPERVQSFALGFGMAHVFYPEASAERCTAALVLDVDPVALVRGRRGPAGEGRALEHYVNDRPYVASSFLSVAIAEVLSTALRGSNKDRAELAAMDLPLEATIAALPSRGGESLLRRLFEPLGYEVMLTRAPLDQSFPAWGESAYFTVELRAQKRLSELLSHLYVLVPVLDDEKHYWVGDDEVAKLLRRGDGWLAGHPERELIAYRYLKHKRHLAREALARLADEGEGEPEPEPEPEAASRVPEEERISLNEQRLGAVLSVLKASGARRVLDLGCGEGHLLARLLKEPQFQEIVGLDVSHRALETARDRLRLERLPERQRGRINLLQGSLTYRDARIEGFDAAAVVEVVEHLDPERLASFERVIFQHARPGTVALTTPNRDYNVRWETLPAGTVRHADHRFEWSRVEFQGWAAGVAERHGYQVRFLPVGATDAQVGPPTQVAVFSRE